MRTALLSLPLPTTVRLSPRQLPETLRVREPEIPRVAAAAQGSPPVLTGSGRGSGRPLILAGGLASMLVLLVLVGVNDWFVSGSSSSPDSLETDVAAMPTVDMSNGAAAIPASEGDERAARPDASVVRPPTSGSALTSVPTESTMLGASPAQSVAQFYRLVGDGELGRALQLWSTGLQRDYPPNENLYGRFRDTERIQVQRADVVSMDQPSGRAAVAVDLVETRRGGTTARWIGTWYLVRDGQTWLLDTPALREV
jgi:hypothetical protein